MQIVVEGRTFIVKFDGNGFVTNIYERKLYAPGKPWEHINDFPYYNAKNYQAKGYKRTNPGSMLRRVMKAIKEQQQLNG